MFFKPLSANPQNGQLHLSNLTHLSMGLFDHFVGFALKRVSHGRLNNPNFIDFNLFYQGLASL